MRKCEVENNEHVLCSIVPKGHSPSETITGTFLLALAPPFYSFVFFLLFFSFSGTVETKHNHVFIQGEFSQPTEDYCITSVFVGAEFDFNI